jgi:hypothetical protein
MLKRQGRGETAEAPLRASIDSAPQQQAKFWEVAQLKDACTTN